ncbi:MAG: hypothetical protein ABJA49_06595 [Betaproteobacteria bacterium]
MNSFMTGPVSSLWPNDSLHRGRRGPADQRISAMHHAFAPSGGLRAVRELTLGNDRLSSDCFDHVAMLIKAREIIGFQLQAELWVPMFQFDHGAPLKPSTTLKPLIELLMPLYDNLEMAYWLARPNLWLSGQKPVDVCAARLSAVLDVAHLEHFIAATSTQHQDGLRQPDA